MHLSFEFYFSFNKRSGINDTVLVIKENKLFYCPHAKFSIAPFPTNPTKNILMMPLDTVPSNMLRKERD